MLGVILIGCGGDSGGAPAQPPVNEVPQALDALMTAEQRQATHVGAKKCGECHGARSEGRGIHADWEQTIHALKGVECEKCHGPGSAHVAAGGDKTKILGFPNITSPLVCAQCHSAHVTPGLSQFNEWSQSRHREIVETVVAEGVENPNTYVRTCFRCHSAAFKVQVVDKNLDIGSMTADQLRVYASQVEESLHENDPLLLASTVNCASCHDPHAKTGNIIDEEGKDLQVREKAFVPPGSAELANIGPGATPDQYTRFDHVCGQCHNGRGTNPSDEALQRSTARPSMHDSNQFNMLVGQGGAEGSGPVVAVNTHATINRQCVTCHMGNDLANHSFTVKMDNCAPCHTPSDAANRRLVAQNDVTSKLLALKLRLENWGQATAGNPKAWEYSSNGGPASADQANVPIEIKRARHNYYFVIRDRSFGVHNAAYTRFILEVANKQLDNLNVARVKVNPQSRSLAEARSLFRQNRSSAESGGFLD